MAGGLISLFFGAEFSDATRITQILLLASLFMAGRRVLTDGVNGYGYPGLGTIAEVASWVILVPGLVVLLPWLGAEGVALALTIAWGASLLLLLVLALFAGRAPTWSGERLARTGRYLTALPGRFPARQALGFAGAVILAVLGGLAAAFLPTVAAGVAIALSACLFFAFARRTLAEHARALQRRVARSRFSELQGDETSEHTREAGFDVPRRLYYGGVLLLGLLVFRAGGQLAFSDLLFLFSFLLAAAEFVVLRRRVPMKLPFLLLIGIALFSLGGLLSTFESYAPLPSIAVIARLVFLTVFWFWLGTVVLRRPEHVTRAIGFWVASAAICGAGAIVQIAMGDVIPNAILENGRATGFTTHPNELGGLTAIAFVPALMLASRPGVGAGTRARSYLMLLLVAAGLILSGSVGALIAAAVAVLAWLAFQRTSIHSLLAFATLSACVVAVITLQSIRGAPDPLDRLASVTGSSSVADGSTPPGSVELRLDTYNVAIARIKDDPFVGVGLDLKSVTRPYGIESWEYDVHNLIIGLWYKTGLLGLAGMLIALLAILRSGWNGILRSRSAGESSLSVALASSMVAFLVFALSEPVLFSRFGWITAALILALRALQQEDESPAPAAYPREEPRAAAAFSQP
jgi:O-antigen ligase